MKSKAKRLIESIHRLQIMLYDFGDELEEKAGRAKSNTAKQKFLYGAQAANDAGFELDISTAALKRIEYHLTQHGKENIL